MFGRSPADVAGLRRARTRLARRAWPLAVIAVGLAAWAFWLEPASLRSETHRLALERWPQSCSPLRIAILGDLHVGSPHNGLDNLERIVDATAAVNADLILLPGDFVISGVLGGSFVPPEAIAAELGRLTAPLGVFAVLGNHDWWYDGPQVRAALERHGIAVLEDRSQRITRGDCTFWVAGISDYWEAAHDLDRALGEIPAGAPVLAFTHNPDIFPSIPASVSLTIAAHTHGGQVCLPIVGRPVVPSEYGQRFAIGHIVEDGRHLFVSSGIGTSILPVRFRVPPEISVVDLSGPEP